MKRNPISPWNPNKSCQITPEEFEEQVLSWLKLIAKINSLSFELHKKLTGMSGDYEFDGMVKLEIFRGAEIIVLVECKRYSRPVEREKILSLYSKLQEVGAHKAMIFSTSGFQSGALKYAKDKGIACISLVSGEYLYETRDLNGNYKPPPWVSLSKYSAVLLEKTNGSISCTTIDNRNIEKLRDFFIRKRNRKLLLHRF